MARFCGFEAPVASPAALISRPNDPWSVCNQLQPVRDVGWEEERCVLACTSNPLVYNSSYGNTEVIVFCKTVAKAVCFSLRDIWDGDWDEGWKPMVHCEAPGTQSRMKGLMHRGRLGTLPNLPFGLEPVLRQIYQWQGPIRPWRLAACSSICSTSILRKMSDQGYLDPHHREDSDKEGIR